MNDQRSQAEQLYDATGIDLKQVQVIGVEGDPDVEALSRLRVQAVQHQASAWLSSRAYQPVPFVSRLPLPVPIILACNFCGDPTFANETRWRLVGIRTYRDPKVKPVICLGGLACDSCYPLSREDLIEVHRKRKAA